MTRTTAEALLAAAAAGASGGGGGGGGGASLVLTGLVAYFDAFYTASYSGSGTAWNDLSPSDYDGTLVNGPTFVTGAGSAGGSISFDGTNDYAQFPHGNNLPTGGAARSLGALFYVPSAVSAKEIIGLGLNGGGGSRFALWITDNTKIGVENGAQQALVNWSGAGNWTYLVAAYPGTLSPTSNTLRTTSIYVNGTPRTMLAGTDGVVNTASVAGGARARIGTVPAAEGFHQYLGLISSVQVYNRALTLADVEQNWAFFSQRL